MSNKIKSVKFTPSEPIEHSGKTYSELEFKQLRVKHLVAADGGKSETEKMFRMIASMAGVPLPVIEELLVEDLNNLLEVVTPLLGDAGAQVVGNAQGAPSGNDGSGPTASA